MFTRRPALSPPSFIFTADYHERLEGDLLPGPCRLLYDPFRIVPVSDFPNPGAIKCFVKLHPPGSLWEQTLPIAPGVLQPELYSPSGEGFMLETTFPLPGDCVELEFWFSYVDSSGSVRWDSAGGANYHLRFPTSDLSEPDGIIVPGDAAFDRLQVTVASIPWVEAIELHWRLVGPTRASRQCALVSSPGDDGLHWSTPDGGVPVPAGSMVVFDLVYYVQGRPHTDNHGGSGYLTKPN